MITLMPDLPVTFSDPRLREVADLSRFETRVQVIMWLGGAVFTGLFTFIGFIPSPLNDRIEYLCLQLTGHIDSRTVGWSVGIVMVVLMMVSILGLAALPPRLQPSLGGERLARLELLRSQLQAEGFTTGQFGYWTAANWQRFFRLTGIIAAFIAVIAWGFIYGVHEWLPPSTHVVRNINLETGRQPTEGLVRLSAVARLDLAFRVSTRHYGAAMLSGDDTNIYRLDAYGYQPFHGSGYHETLYVPLTAPDWRPGQPIGVFYQCEFACAVSAPRGIDRVPTSIVVTGLLHRARMPLYVRRSFEAAGIAVASPYAVIRDEQTDPLQPFAIVALIGFLLAVIFLGVPPFYRWSVKRQARKKTTRFETSAA